jgi:hypothetical protein
MAKKWGLLQKFGKKSEKKVKFFSKMGKKAPHPPSGCGVLLKFTRLV